MQEVPMRTRLRVGLGAIALLMAACASLPPPSDGTIMDRREVAGSIFFSTNYYLKIDGDWFRVDFRTYKSCERGDTWKGKGC